MTEPLLTICIPTYNRAKNLSSLLDGIKDGLLTGNNFFIEIIVVDNCSEDETPQVTEKYKDVMRIVRRTVHLPTAEENVLHSLDFCNGKYVWFLGDDDVLNYVHFLELYKILQEDIYDHIVFNSPVLCNKPYGKEFFIYKMQEERFELSGGIEFLKNVGTLTLMAGFSVQILRRDRLKKDQGLEWFSVFPIYSHIFWISECFENARGVVLNIPLIISVRNEYGDHWKKVARRIGVWDQYFWTMGLLKLITRYFDRNGFPAYYFAEFLEYSLWINRRFRVIDDLVWKMLIQVELDKNSYGDVKTISKEELLYIEKFVLKADPKYFEIFRSILSLYEINSRKYFNRKVVEIRGNLSEFISNQTFSSRLIRKTSGYSIYKFPKSYVAILDDCPVTVSQIFQWLDPPENSPYVLNSISLEGLLFKINSQNFNYNLNCNLNTNEVKETLGRGGKFLLRMFNLIKFSFGLFKHKIR